MWNDKLYFAADDGTHGRELWVTDGTAANTTLLRDTDPLGGGNPGSFRAHGDKLFFTAFSRQTGRELWVTDGTTAGTQLVKDIHPGPTSSTPFELNVVGGRVVFAAYDATSGRELWETDGTGAGTRLLKDIEPGNRSSNPSRFVRFGDLLYFAASTTAHARELWKTDGTAAGTVLVKDIVPGQVGSVPVHLTECGGKLFFFAKRGSLGGSYLWTTDGTESGTVLVPGDYPGAGFDTDTRAASIVCSGGKLFFSLRGEGRGVESLHCSDGKTVLRLGGDRLSPQFLSSIGDLVYFVGVTQESGGELWVSDGTVAGTRQVCELWPGPRTGMGATFDDLGAVVACGGGLFFRGRTPVHGIELFRLVHSQPIVQPVGEACGPDYPTLSATPLRVGETFEWSGTQAPASRQWVGIVLLGARYTNPVSLDATGALAPASCRVYLNPLARLFLRPVAPMFGERTWRRTDGVPNATSLVGVTAAAQAWFLETGAPHTIVRMQGTNGLHLTVGQ